MDKQEQISLSFAKLPERSNPTGQVTWAQNNSNLHISVERLLAGHQHTKNLKN